MSAERGSKPRKSLVPQSTWQRLAEASPDEGTRPLAGAKLIETSRVVADPNQPRKYFEAGGMAELIASVRERGILQPITVQRQEDGNFRIITGERRWRAATALEMPYVPALVVELTDNEARLDRVVENRQRRGLRDYEMAVALREIKRDLGHDNPGMSSNELDELTGKQLGMSGRSVRNFLAMMNVPQEIRDELGEDFSELATRGVSLLRDHPEKRDALVKAIKKHDLSGRQTVELARLLNDKPGMSMNDAIAQVQNEPSRRAAFGGRKSYIELATRISQANRLVENGALAAASDQERDDLLRLLQPLLELQQQIVAGETRLGRRKK